MSIRGLSLLALVPVAVVIAACGDDTGINTANLATVGFVNATGISVISVANNGVVTSGNGSLLFGGSTSCMQVNTGLGSPLVFTDASGATVVGFTPTFTVGNHYTVVAFTNASGNTAFATINDAFTPNAGNAGVIVFNAAGAGANGAVVLGNGTVLGRPAVASGTAGVFFNVPAGTLDITFNTGTGTATIADLGNMSFNAGQNYVLVLGPAAPGSTTLRGTLVPTC